MWVKICGNTTVADAEFAIEAGANALGFVFAPGPRQVTPAQVAAITQQLGRHSAHHVTRVERYGVFVDALFDEIVETVMLADLTGVQLHSTPDPLLATRLREHFSAVPRRKRLGLLRVLHLPAGSQANTPKDFSKQLLALQQDHAIDALLVDSRTATASGGTGLTFDWAAASGAFLKAAPHLRIIVAGGLSPGNVAEAIATLRPWGVDVVTGVEAEPGRKDQAKVRAFITRARATARAMASTAVARA